MTLHQFNQTETWYTVQSVNVPIDPGDLIIFKHYVGLVLKKFTDSDGFRQLKVLTSKNNIISVTLQTPMDLDNLKF